MERKGEDRVTNCRFPARLRGYFCARVCMCVHERRERRRCRIDRVRAFYPFLAAAVAAAVADRPAGGD